MTMSIKSKEESVLSVIRFYHGQLGYAPTLREISSETGIKLTNLDRVIVRLEARGIIAREIGKARTLRIVK